MVAFLSWMVELRPVGGTLRERPGATKGAFHRRSTIEPTQACAYPLPPAHGSNAKRQYRLSGAIRRTAASNPLGTAGKRPMSIAMGAWLAAVLGLVTGSVWASIRHPANRVWIIVAAVLGAALAELVYGACLAAGFVLSFMFVTGPPAAAPALLCVVIGSA